MWKKVPYKSLNAKQQENFNFQKVSAVLADYGFCTLRLSDDWNGADFIAVHVSGDNSLNIQLKGRLTFDKKYQNRNIWVCFPYKGEWFLYPHDILLEKLKSTMNFHNTESWSKGAFSWNTLSKALLSSLSEYKL